MMVGNGLTDPATAYHKSELLYQLGLLDTREYAEMKSVEEEGIAAIREGNLPLAADVSYSSPTSIQNMFLHTGEVYEGW